MPAITLIPSESIAFANCLASPASVHSQIETNGEVLSCACGSRLSRLSDAWGPGRRADRQAEWQFGHGRRRTREAIQAVRYVNLLSRLGRKF